MNSGRPVWHASIAWHKARGPVPIQRWGEGVRRDAQRRLLAALEGVGAGETVIQSTSGVALHARRSLNDEEMKLLTPEWLAIPARDEFGPDGVIEMRL